MRRSLASRFAASDRDDGYMRALFLVMGLISSSAGCAYSVPAVWVPPDIPMSSVDMRASEVRLEAPAGDLSVESARELRASVAELLTEGVAERAGEAARFRAEVTFVEGEGVIDALQNGPTILILPVILLFLPAGLSNGTGEATLSLEIDVDRKTYVGRGTGRADGSIYADAVTRATSVALQDALSKLTLVERPAARVARVEASSAGHASRHEGSR
jgi:hypothetical protein